MSEYQPLTTTIEIDQLDSDDCLNGYRAGLDGEPEPGSDKSKSYWHGWRNGMMDKGHLPHDAEAMELARAFVAKKRAH